LNTGTYPRFLARLQAIVKSFTALGSDESKPEKFIGYMVPKPEEV
jgi:hypothetical protein